MPWRLAVSRASKIKSGLGRLVEPFPVHPLQPVSWSLPGCLRGPPELRAPWSLPGCPYRYLAPAGLSSQVGQPARHQGGTREARKDLLDSQGGTREAPGRQERIIWTAWEAPGRHQGLLKAILRYEDGGGLPSVVLGY